MITNTPSDTLKQAPSALYVLFDAFPKFNLPQLLNDVAQCEPGTLEFNSSEYDERTNEQGQRISITPLFGADMFTILLHLLEWPLEEDQAHFAIGLSPMKPELKQQLMRHKCQAMLLCHGNLPNIER